MENTDILAVVATIERGMSSLSMEDRTNEHRTTITELRSSWNDLVTLLALEPKPAIRACPACGRTVMRAATRCGFCWRKLSVATETR